MTPRSVRTARVAITVAVLGLACVMAVAANDAWWTDAVFYEVFVRSFQDSDGDGIGDLRGLIDRLDYLNDGDPTTTDDLGVTGLWLMPVLDSPSYHGYDTVDYYAIEPDYGTLDDFRELLDAAHRRGIRVVIDLMLNHTSQYHPWFEASIAQEDPYTDWYIWSEAFQTYRGPWDQQVWHLQTQGVYYGIFSRNMPDLNLRNPYVTLAMLDIAWFWLDEVGVDGFRLDAVKHLIEEGEIQENTLETHDWLETFRIVTKEARGDAVLIGEVWSSPETILTYLEGEMDLCFEFSLADGILRGVDEGASEPILNALRTVLDVYPAGAYAPFLTNHDQERVATRLGGNIAKMKLAASILLTLPGTPFLYYGEEIGMAGAKPDPEIRTPMQWSSSASAGFSVGIPWQPLAAVARGRPVDAQQADAASLWSRYRDLIRIRSEHEALRTADTTIVATEDSSLLSYLRGGTEGAVWVIHNLGSAPSAPTQLVAEAALLSSGTYQAGDLLAGNGPFSITIEGRRLLGDLPEIAPQSTLILNLRAI